MSFLRGQGKGLVSVGGGPVPARELVRHFALDETLALKEQELVVKDRLGLPLLRADHGG